MSEVADIARAWRIRQASGKKLPCPRCGRATMKKDLCTNALSRHAQGVYICDACGISEAVLDYLQGPLPLGLWAWALREPRRRKKEEA